MHGLTFFDEYAAQNAASITPGSNQAPIHPQPETVPAAPAETVPVTPAEIVKPEQPAAPAQVQTTQEPASVPDQEGGTISDGT